MSRGGEQVSRASLHPSSWQKCGPVEFPSRTPKPGAPKVPTALGLFGYPKIKLSLSRRTHLQQITDEFPGGPLLLLAGAVKCDAPGAFSASSVHVLQLWEYEEKVPQKTAVFFLIFFPSPLPVVLTQKFLTVFAELA